MNLMTGFKNVALGGYLRYGLMSREERLNDLLALTPTVQGLTPMQTLDKAMNLAIAMPGRPHIFPGERLARFAVREISNSVERAEPLEDRAALYEKIFNFARWVTDDPAEQGTFYAKLLTYAHGQQIMAQSDIDLIEKTVREEAPAIWSAHVQEQDRIRAAYGR